MTGLLPPLLELLPAEMWREIGQADQGTHDEGYAAGLLARTCRTLHALFPRATPPTLHVFLRWLGRHVEGLHFMGDGPELRIVYDERIVRLANINPLDSLVFGAIECGRLATLLAVRRAWVQMDSLFLDHAISTQQRPIIEWLVNVELVPRTYERLVPALDVGDLAFLDWLYDMMGFRSLESDLILIAAGLGREDLIRWLHARGCRSGDGQSLFICAAARCSVATLSWLLAETMATPWPYLPIQAMDNSMEVIKWLLGEPCRCTVDRSVPYLAAAIREHNWPVVEWFVATHGRWGSEQRIGFLPVPGLSIPELDRLWALGLRPPTTGFEYDTDPARVAWLVAHGVEPSRGDVNFLVMKGAVDALRALRERFGPLVVPFTAAHTRFARESEDEAMLEYLAEADTPL